MSAMEKNFYQWSRPKSGGLYLIELRQRFARGKSLRQQLAVRVGEFNAFRRPGILLDQLNPPQSDPVEVA